MNAKMLIILSVLAPVMAGAQLWGSSARAQDNMNMRSCAMGYHQGPHGNCQPDAYIPGPCGPGTYYQSFPNGNGFRCQPDGY